MLPNSLYAPNHPPLALNPKHPLATIHRWQPPIPSSSNPKSLRSQAMLPNSLYAPNCPPPATHRWLGNPQTANY